MSLGRALGPTLALPLLTCASAGQLIVVPPGGDLISAVSGAPSGAVVEIQSDGTYLASLVVSGKALTIRAGQGFRPTIQGLPDLDAVVAEQAALPTVLTLEGLRLVAGGTQAPGLAAVAVRPGAQPQGTASLTVRDSTLEGQLSVVGAFAQAFDVSVERCDVRDALGVTAVGSGIHVLDVTDSRLQAGLVVFQAQTSTLDATVRRTEVVDTFEMNVLQGTTATLLLESSLVRTGPVPRPTGVLLGGDPGGILGRLVNVTVRGFATGVETTGLGTTMENLLLVENFDDLGPSVDVADVANSLISDGTFDGLNGNFQAPTLLDPAGALPAGVAGVDAGNELAAGLSGTDLNGDPRVQDGDGDGTPRVNVGAVESLSCAPVQQATQAIRVGTPANPLALLPALDGGPTVGDLWIPRIDHTAFAPDAATDVLAVAVASLNVPLAGWGTLLIDPTKIRATKLVPLLTAFSVEVPGDCSLVGRPVYAQAASLGGVGGVQLTNALDAVIGLF